MDKRKKKLSPYARKGKVPHRYSENYQRWRGIFLTTGMLDTSEQQALNTAHRARYGLPPQGFTIGRGGQLMRLNALDA